MCKLLLRLLLVGFLSIGTAQAFEPSYSFSRILLDAKAGDLIRDNISSQIQTGLISSSINGDLFSRIEVFSTAIEFRGCDCGKSPSKAEINEYIENNFKEFPDNVKSELKENLVRTKNIEEELRRKMFNPDLTDEEVLIYAREREKLLKNALEYEAEITNNFYRLIKPEAYRELESSFRDIHQQQENLEYQIASKGILEDAFKQYEQLETLYQKAVRKLIEKPLEVRSPAQGEIRKLNQSATDKYAEYLNSISLTQ
ncbi:hypothetical protein A7985_06505 [Pseudoalteromonas luteoviolacea]|uniref:DUF2059 domain-containing protein n=1 Tax=Pseudoalteromonas luteoviolacea TaxID=43657 RepID=A0A1C0TWA2_9GAMM|nr:hypothetical protein [Pseudoalteromonas luteoviolacea]OCQ23589.1 hypothetical protein A7985_06505 [Pseudoalteromonas luteoviolacea]